MWGWGLIENSNYGKEGEIGTVKASRVGAESKNGVP